MFYNCIKRIMTENQEIFNVEEKTKTTNQNSILLSYLLADTKCNKNVEKQTEEVELFNCDTIRETNDFEDIDNYTDEPSYITDNEIISLINAETNEETNYNCEHCAYTARKRDSLRRHVQTKHKTPYYSCTKCSFTTHYKSNLRMHENIHDKPKLKCDHCSYETLWLKSMKVHKALKHNIKDAGVPLFKCDECDHVTYRRDNLRKHQRTHQGTTFKCDLCEFETVWQQSMRTHKIAMHNSDEIGDHVEIQ